MAGKQIIIEIEGPDASSAAVDLSQTLAREFNNSPVITPLEHHKQVASAGNKFDPALAGIVVGSAGVMLAIPGAVLASFQLKDRLAKKNGFDQLVEQGKKIKETKKLTSIRFRIGNTEIEFEKASYAKIADYLEK